VAEVAREVMDRRDWTLRAPGTEIADIAVLTSAFNDMLAQVEASTAGLTREMAERRRAEDNLRAADRKKDEFLATLAHELRNPLAPMTNAVALLAHPRVSPALRDQAVAILDRQLRHTVRLIDDLLDVSRITTGKLSLVLDPIDGVAVVRSALELVDHLVRERRLELVVDLPPPPCAMVGDAARLLQVVSNLLSNACRYTPPGGLIELRLAASASEVVLTVRDTGVGIEPAMQERIFELFEQADKSLERGNVGLGIGLTLARQLVQLHGGTIGVHSDGIGQGACFTVRLPRGGDAGAATLPAPTVATPAAPLSLLVADDNVDFCSSLQTLLETGGHRVRTVHDGRAALAAALADPPDAAILAVGMPQLNGLEVARQLRAHPATAAVTLIAVTGWGQSDDQAAALAAGFDLHCVKPVTAEALLQALAPVRPAATPGLPPSSA
jgi:signal transduction histidine kinase/ActR/RegA family two-component response regulator